MDHNFHRTIANALAIDVSPGRILWDPACGGSNRLSLFCESTKSRSTRYAHPDAVLIADGSARLIIEIEEAGQGFLPVRITGKLMTPALCRYLTIHSRSQPIPFSKDMTFVQVLNTTGLPPGSRKLEQYANIERDIQALTPFGSISAYQLIPGDAEAFTFGDAGARLRKAVSISVADSTGIRAGLDFRSVSDAA